MESHFNRKLLGKAVSGFYRVCMIFLPVYMFMYTYLQYYRKATFHEKGNYLFGLLYITQLVFFMIIYGGFKIHRFRTRELVFSFVLASAITDVITYGVMCLIAARVFSVWPIFFTMLLQWVAETVLLVIIRVTGPFINPSIPTLYIRGSEDSADTIAQKFSRRYTPYSIDGIVSDSMSIEALQREALNYDAILTGEIDGFKRKKLQEYCFLQGKTLLLIPDMNDIMLCSSEQSFVGDMLMFSVSSSATEQAYRIVKRCFDIVVSAIALIVLSPLFGVVSYLIHKHDNGPVFYKQKRLTKNGKEFMLVKFRSMVVNAESATGAVLAGKDDARITPIGKFIRSTRIDELPQLWNIFLGEMSLVGPRPERPEFYTLFCEEYPEFAYRLKAKAGLTGYAQLYGKYSTTFRDKAKLDMYYIQRASFFMDLQLLFYTLKIIFVRESSEGVSAGDSRGADEEKER